MQYTIDTGEVRQVFPSLHFVGCNKFFRALYELEQHTLKEVKRYIEDNDLSAMFSLEEFKSFTKGVLHACLGETQE